MNKVELAIDYLIKANEYIKNAERLLRENIADIKKSRPPAEIKDPSSVPTDLLALAQKSSIALCKDCGLPLEDGRCYDCEVQSS